MERQDILSMMDEPKLRATPGTESTESKLKSDPGQLSTPIDSKVTKYRLLFRCLRRANAYYFEYC
jgi:hypothetical protein